MKDKEFDIFIKESLNKVSSSKKMTDHWTMMEDLIDSMPDLEEVDPDFDSIVSGAVEKVPFDLKSSHWDMMESRLDEEFINLDNIWNYKLIELFLFALLIIGISNYLVEPDSLHNRIYKSELVEGMIETSSAPDVIDSKNKEIDVSNVAKGTELNLLPVHKGSIGIVSDNTSKIIRVLPFIPQLEIKDLSVGIEDKYEINIRRTVKEIENRDIYIYSNPSSLKNKVKKLKEKFLIIDMYLTADINYTSLKENLFGVKLSERAEELANSVKEDYFVVTDGYGIGLNIGYQVGRFKVETGWEYHNKNFIENPKIKVLQGSFEEGYHTNSLRSVNMDVITLPLNFSYYLNNVGGFKCYTSLGASLNLVGWTDYFTTIGKTQLYLNYNSLHNGPYNQGLFEGNRFGNSSYMSIDGGFGMEIKFSQRWSLFLDGLYHQNVLNSGVGQLEASINTLSFSLGTRAAL